MGKWAIVSLFILAACGAPNLGAVDLESLLIQDGDLPAGINAAQVKDTPPGMFTGLPRAVKAIDQRFQASGGNAGGVTVLLYDTTADRDTAYDSLVKGMGNGTKPYNGVGERATTLALSIVIDSVDVAFVRCHAVAYIRMSDTKQVDNATAYAARLDSRLRQVVC